MEKINGLKRIQERRAKNGDINNPVDNYVIRSLINGDYNTIDYSKSQQ